MSFNPSFKTRAKPVQKTLFPRGPPVHFPPGSATPSSPSLTSRMFAGGFLALAARRRRRRGRPALRQLFPWPLLYLQHCAHICFPLCLFPCRWEPGFKSLLSAPAARRGFHDAQHAPFGWASKSCSQASPGFFSFFFFPSPPEPANAATLLSPPPFWPRSYLGSGTVFRHLVAGSVGLWQRPAACGSSIGKGGSAGAGRRDPPWLPGTCRRPPAPLPHGSLEPGAGGSPTTRISLALPGICAVEKHSFVRHRPGAAFPETH